MKISIVAALDDKNGIGKENKIPWHIKDDLVRLKRLTLGNTVILGRKTFESMVGYYDKSGRPMPGKLYIVVTRNSDYKPARENALAVFSVEEAVDQAAKMGESEIFIIGGEQIYKESLEKALVDRLYLTKVKGDFGADTFFPGYSKFEKVVEKEERQNGDVLYTFLTLDQE